MVQPLDGVKVVDLTRVMSGPYATVLLADHGADVVKVEGLPKGDASREFGVDFVGSESAVYLMWNRGKRDLALDLRRPEAVEVVRRLAREADVVLENYRPGVAEQIGLGYEQLRAENPRLIYCSITAFGARGAMSQLPGTDTVVQAASGIMSVTGDEDGDPTLAGVPVADHAAALLAVQGILLALLARERTGEGQHVEISMLQGMLSMLSTRLASFWATGTNPGRTGSAHSVLVPYQAFRTADGSAMIGAWRQHLWPGFCAAIERPDLERDPRYQSNVDRQRHKADLLGELAKVFEERTTAEWQDRFAGTGVVFAPVNTFSDIMGHDHVADAGYVSSVVHPTLGELPQLSPLVGLSETPGRIASAPPLLGQHSTQILRELGYDDTTLADWRERGVFVQSD